LIHLEIAHVAAARAPGQPPGARKNSVHDVKERIKNLTYQRTATIGK